MKKYEAPSYEVEYFTLRNDVLTDTSENAGNDFDLVDEEGNMGPRVF